MHKFPRLSTESAFPNLDNVEVYKYDNDFDYSRYDYSQMDLLICTVPWDMGEAHIGNRTISGIGNVVHFGNKKKRDEWFDAIPDSECYRFTTKFKELHREHMIDVPIPYDVCAKHNYLKVHYNLFANDDSPVEYEDETGLRDWFWFIREVEFIAPNTTRLHILDDAFQTWIYDIDITGMMLERGHAPMFKTRADAYLDNPLENNTDLLTEDVNFGAISQVKHVDVLELNSGDMYACIATTADPTSLWGTKSGNDWKTPASAVYTNNGYPSVYVFAVAASSFGDFLGHVTADIPQFKQTVQGVFFANSKLLRLSSSFTFASTTCYNLESTRTRAGLVHLSKSLFGYDAKYADIAKLYTSPYSQIEIADETGNVDIVKIEDTNGTIDVSVALSIAYPFITVDAHLLGVGGDARATVTYKNISSHTFDAMGRWYDTLRTWKVPLFAVVLDAAREYDYSTHFDRAQRVIDYTTAYNNASELASASKSDRDASADTMKSNEDASADLITANALLTTTANTAITNISNGSADHALDNTRSYNFTVMDIDNSVISSTATSQIQATEEQAAVTAASGAATSTVSAISSAVTGDIAGAVSSAVTGIIGGAATLASTNISVHLQQAEAQIARSSNEDHSEAATGKTEADTATQKGTATSITGAQNTLTSGQAANASATQKANATRSQGTEKANALRDYNAAIANAGRTRTQAQNSISNDIAQAALRAPYIYGSFDNGESAANKPMALFANIVTQSKGAIAAAGDEFLRYGYMLDRYWEFDGNWNVGRYFTYWKLRDFWVTNLNIPDMYMDRLRFFLLGGVTIWRTPEDIGKRTIYDNFQ